MDRWAVLRWGGVAAYPFVLHVAAVNGSQNAAGVPYLRYVLPILVLALLAGLLRRRPLPALVLMIAGVLVMAAMVDMREPGFVRDTRYLQFVALDAAVAHVAATRSRWLSGGAAALVLAAQIAAATLWPLPSRDLMSEWAVLTLAAVTAWMIGYLLRERREHAEALRAQVLAQAVTAERLRIARELHDMVAHSIGVIAIQAGMGGRVIDTQPAEARDALRAIESTSRETLAGLRRMLVALRSSPGGPGLADLDRLADVTREAGVRVDVRWEGRRRPLPPEIDLSAFRIIQEAVTNVVRHAGTPDCRVTVDYRDEELSIEIADGGRGAPASTLPGYGIAGMRERVSLLHGQFSAGPHPSGGFRVAAVLPMGVR